LLLTVLIAIHALVLIGGGAYTYAHVPFGFWLQDILGTLRNPYDKIGHFMQGFVPAMVAREIPAWRLCARPPDDRLFVRLCRDGDQRLLRTDRMGRRRGPRPGRRRFLGTQGDVWDTQSDMFMALIGASTALLLLARWHDRQLAALRPH
jgi:putative membrane protein